MRHPHAVPPCWPFYKALSEGRSGAHDRDSVAHADATRKGRSDRVADIQTGAAAQPLRIERVKAEPSWHLRGRDQTLAKHRPTAELSTVAPSRPQQEDWPGLPRTGRTLAHVPWHQPMARGRRYSDRRQLRLDDLIGSLHVPPACSKSLKGRVARKLQCAHDGG
jgi:hypothetical protein